MACAYFNDYMLPSFLSGWKGIFYYILQMLLHGIKLWLFSYIDDGITENYLSNEYLFQVLDCLLGNDEALFMRAQLKALVYIHGMEV